MKSVVLSLLLFGSASVFAQAPVFKKPLLIKPVGTTGTAPYYFTGVHHPDPCIADWDDDGLADLIVGQFSGGRVKWWKNTGSVGNPRFEYKGLLYADGKKISVGAT